MKFWRLLVATGLFFALAPPLPAGAATRGVTIPGRSFSPAEVTIRIGDTVRWVNSSGERHSVTATSDSRAQGEAFDSNPRCGPFPFNNCLRPGQSYSHTFRALGTFSYYCRRHGSDASYPNCGMCGQVTVVRKSSSTGSPTTPGSRGPTPGSGSPSGSPSNASPSPTGATSGPSSAVAAPGGGGGGSTSVLAIAALGVALLGASGYVVYRTMIRG